jgi:apolipoprotein N-acyltransferase
LTDSVSRRGGAPIPGPVSARWAAVLAVACGLLYFLAFPSPDVWHLSAVALVPLFVALDGQAPRRAAWLGWLAGFTMTMVGFYWLLDLLETFSGFGTPLCLLFTAILCGYQSGRIALMGWLHARLARRGWIGAVTFPLAFAASEQAFPLLFPWSYAATVHQVPALNQLAELGGPILVALPLVALNVALAELILARRARAVVPWRRIGLLAVLPVLSALYGAVRIPAVDARAAAAPKGRVGLVQANMSLMGKRLQPGEGLRRHLSLSRELTRLGKIDLLVWSETSVMSALYEEDVPFAVPERFAASLKVPALFGAVIVKQVEDARRYILFNSALLTDRKGAVVGRFDKQRLVMFSESMPFGETFPILYEWSPNSGKFVPGTRYDPLTFGEHQVATIICYEDIIPGFVNRIVNNGEPDLIANLTNDAWFGDTTEPWIHLALSQLRAVEHRRYFVRSTNSGVSAVIDPVGRVVKHGGTFEEQALLAEISWLRGKTAYELFGDVPWWLASLVALGFAVARPRRRLDAESSRTGPSVGPGASAANPFTAKSRAWFARHSSHAPADSE